MEKVKQYRHELKFAVSYADYLAMRTRIQMIMRRTSLSIMKLQTVQRVRQNLPQMRQMLLTSSASISQI